MRTITTVKTINVDGTSLQGYLVDIEFADLVDILGEPVVRPHDGKTRAEWHLQVGSVVITLYDWKEDIDLEQVNCWHIGGHSRRAVEIVARLLGPGQDRARLTVKYPQVTDRDGKSVG